MTKFKATSQTTNELYQNIDFGALAISKTSSLIATPAKSKFAFGLRIPMRNTYFTTRTAVISQALVCQHLTGAATPTVPKPQIPMFTGFRHSH